MTEALVKLFVPKRYQNITSVLETYASIKNRFLLAAGTIIHPINHLTMCRILNPGTTSKKLKARMPIAQVSSIDMNDPNNRAMLTVDATEANYSESHNVRSTLPPHDERLKFLETKGLRFENHQMTDQQLAELTALLYEFESIFCADYETLPMSKLPPYHIKLDDDRPLKF